MPETDTGIATGKGRYGANHDAPHGFDVYMYWG